MIPDNVPTATADNIVAALMATPSLDKPADPVAEVRDVAAKIRAIDPGVDLYLCAGLDGTPMLFRPISRREWQTVMMRAIPGGYATQQAIINAGLLYPSYEVVMAECAKRAHLANTIAGEILRVSGQGPQFTFVRWAR